MRVVTTAARAPSLAAAAATVALATYAVWRLAQLVARFASGAAGTDFSWNVSAATIGLRHGWAAVYDRQLYGAFTHHGEPLSYANLPAVAWFAIPFTAVPFTAGLLTWMALLAALLLVAWWVAAPGSGWERVGHLAVLLAASPVLRALELGQFEVAVVALLAVHWWLLRRGRPVLAGVALALACLKPQDVFLVPVVLVLTARWRCAGAWAATVAALALAMALALGPSGLVAYRQNVAQALNPLTTATTLWANLPAWAPAPPLRAAIVLLALTPALFEGAARHGRAVAAAVIGSELSAPYLNNQDLGILVVAGWLVLRCGLPRWARWALVPSYLAVTIPAGPLPRAGQLVVVAPLTTAAFWLLALAAIAVVPWLGAAAGPSGAASPGAAGTTTRPPGARPSSAP
jgi:Glycosyltransferase family 87